MPANAPEVVRAVWQTLDRSAAVSNISLGGSRARGYATELSDWDLYLQADDPAALMAGLPGLVAPLGPLAAFWEPLSENAGYMMVMDGPVKIDLFPVGGRRSMQPPWTLSGATLCAINGHFWDWTLWLGSKALRGETQLVREELAKMRWFLLGPLGVDHTPAELSEAVRLYLSASGDAARRLRTPVPQELGQQVIAALRRHDLAA